MCPSMCQQQQLPLPKIRFDEKLLCFIASSLGLKLNEVFNSERYLFSEAMPLSEAVWTVCSSVSQKSTLY